MRSPETTSSTSLIERSCPIASGVIDWGKTTVSLSGSTGSVVGMSTSLSSSTTSGSSSLIFLVPERDRDLPAARLLRKRHHDLQQPLLVARLGRLRVDVLRERD